MRDTIVNKTEFGNCFFSLSLFLPLSLEVMQLQCERTVTSLNTSLIVLLEMFNIMMTNNL